MTVDFPMVLLNRSIGKSRILKDLAAVFVTSNTFGTAFFMPPETTPCFTDHLIEARSSMMRRMRYYEKSAKTSVFTGAL